MGATMAGGIFRDNRILFTQIAGVIIIIFGLLEIFGKGFSGLNIYLKGSHKTPFGSYLFGAVFAIGWSACTGPILASLLLLSSTTSTVLKGTILLFIYGLGLAIPLILVSLFFDRIRNNRFWKILQGRGITITAFNKQITLHSTYLYQGYC
jgi:cytochrome c-type biogenesis protein